MKNKTWTCLVVVSAALLMAGCGSRTKKQTNEDVSMDSVGVTCSGVKTLQLEGVWSLVRIQSSRLLIIKELS